jgi:hypothetical protein
MAQEQQSSASGALRGEYNLSRVMGNNDDVALSSLFH